tara:strand:+ start:367 stop:810 length:444 start_codon:yes stop_codon:yes gene_type:complete
MEYEKKSFDRSSGTIRDSDKIRTEKEQDSLDRQRRTREEARNRKAARRAEKEKLSEATSTSERREIKEDFKEIQEAIEEGAIFDIETGKLVTNQDDITRSIKDEGIDVIATNDFEEGVSTFTAILCVNGQPHNASILGTVDPNPIQS